MEMGSSVLVLVISLDGMDQNAVLIPSIEENS